MYGTKIDYLSKDGDKYGFVDENKIKITAGFTFVLGFSTFFTLLFTNNYIYPLFIIFLIWLDFLLKTIFSPKFSIFGNLIGIFVKKEPHFVGAVQKRFAWSIGLAISSFVFIYVLLSSQIFFQFNIHEIIPKIIPMFLCGMCLIFMRFEGVVGYCVGCSIYAKLVKKGIIKKVERQNCAGGICEIGK